MDSITLGFVGTGRVAEHYQKVLNSGRVKNFKVISCCDKKISSCLAFTSKFSTPIKIYENVEEMFNQDPPDLAIICTPSGVHYEHAKLALEHNCNVLVEKPSSLIPSQSEELTKIARSKKLLYSVCFQNRFNPAITKLRTTLEEGRFGKITTATIRLRWCRYQEYYNDEWHGTWLQDGGVINQQAIHHIDILNWLMGPVDSVCSTTANRLNILEAEDTHVAIVKFKNGCLGTIEATTAARPEDIEASISIIGEKGVAVIDGIALNKISTWSFTEKKPEDEGVIEKFSENVPTGYGISHWRVLQKTIDYLMNISTKEPIPVSETINTLYLIHSLYASSERGEWVKLSHKRLSAKLGSSQT